MKYEYNVQTWSIKESGDEGSIVVNVYFSTDSYNQWRNGSAWSKSSDNCENPKKK